MVETYPYVFEFTLSGGVFVVDLSRNLITLKLEDREYEFPFPANPHNFCVVLGGILYGKNVSRKQFFFTGRPGERRMIEVRGILYEKRRDEENRSEPQEENQEQRIETEKPEAESKEQAEAPRTERKGKENSEEEQQNPQKKRRTRVILTFIDETSGFKRSFLLNIFNVYALWELFRLQDKVVSVENLVFERREGNVFIQGIPIPFQKAKALFYALDVFLRTGRVPAINQDWEYGRIMLWNAKKRMDFFKRSEGLLVPSGVVKLSTDNALRIMSVL